MALGLSNSNGGGSFDRVPVLKYDARAGRIFRIDREQDASGAWQTDQVEITQDFQAVMDLENIQVGWLHFPAGSAPSINVVKFGEAMPDKPSKDHKQGFRLLMKLGKSCGGDVREMAANAQVSINGIDELHTAYTEGAKTNAGMLPVVKLKTTIAITTKGKDKDGKPQSSTNYQPVWEIVKWVDRPAELNGSASPQAAPASVISEPVTPSKPAHPPEPVAAPAADDDNEF